MGNVSRYLQRKFRLPAVVRSQPNVECSRGRRTREARHPEAQVEQVDRSSREVQIDISNLERDQGRLRQNINSLNQVSGQQEKVGRYARSLAEQETKLAGFRDKQSDLSRQKAALEADISGLIDKMEF